MAMGRRAREQQAAIWIPAAEVAPGPSHPFYQRLNEILAKYGFDEWVEGQCRRFYAERMGRPSLPPGTYFFIIDSLIVPVRESVSGGRKIKLIPAVLEPPHPRLMRQSRMIFIGKPPGVSEARRLYIDMC